MSSSETEDRLGADQAVTADDVEFQADPTFTLPARRLAGSSECLNCGTGLKGPFCYYCGQPDRNFLRFFPALLREFLEDFLDLDSRFARTLKPLLFKPGRLTRDYLDGRRFRYTPPMRLYLFSSIGFFLLAALVSNIAIQEGEVRFDGGDGARVMVNSEEEQRQVEAVLDQLPPGVREQIEVAPPGTSEDENWFDSAEIRFNDEPWDRETNPLDIPFLPQGINDWINDEIARSPEKAEQISQNPNLIVNQIMDLLPGTMFVLLPVVALIFKFWYLFARRYYIEHLILALHNHAFIFVCLIAAMLLEVAEEWFAARGMSTAENVMVWSNLAIGIWIPVYLVLSLRRVYGQNWFLTLGKATVIGISYLSLLGLITSIVAIVGFLLV